MERIPVYFMPGLAASSSIFEHIQLPQNQFEMIMLEWCLPEIDEPLELYAKRIAKGIIKENPVLIGVSFGGILVQEIAKLIATRKVIIISSAKCNREFPLRMRLAKSLKLYTVIPVKWLSNVSNIAKLPIGNKIRSRLHMYELFLAMRDPIYLNWAIKTVLLWNRVEPDSSVIHIHGTADEIFPVKYIQHYIAVPNGTHVMILTKYKWLNENLPQIILK